MTRALHIVGGGMAGSEAAWQAAQLGVPVVIHEMRPKVGTFAHRTGTGGDGVLQLLPLRRRRTERRGAPALGNAGRGRLIMEMADRHRCPPAAPWPWTATRLPRP
jgi:methylenetetrahydrofolate--tRNA-(uracil-5-)-methyltransferase